MDSLEQRLFDEIARFPILDPHSHVDPRAPAARGLGDLLGYHYYTELAHSAGLARERIEGASGVEQARLLVEHLEGCANTVQVSWLSELARAFFDFAGERITLASVDGLFAAAAEKAEVPDWADQVIAKTNLEAVFLTNDFDDPLVGFDTRRYVPCLRTDELVFRLGDAAVRRRLAESAGIEIGDWKSLATALDILFARFLAKGARAAAISLPPDFEPSRPTKRAAGAALNRLLAGKPSADDRRTVAYALLFALADRCEEFQLPFDLMIGVWRDVYPAGVHQGRDLFDNRTSLHQFRQLFNEKSAVRFPVSVLSHQQNQELVAYSWIFPNVLPAGHWWYSNVPTYIEADLRARLDAVPAAKQIGYYSDAYKLEFILPKFNMYRRGLAKVLASEFVVGRRWSEERALDLARCLLRDNIERVFPKRV